MVQRLAVVDATMFAFPPRGIFSLPYVASLHSARPALVPRAKRVKISVIVPIYGAEPYLDRCIQALLIQDCKSDIEILMINNNSPDQSVEIIGRYPQVRLLHQAKQGAYAARNHGILEASGDLLVFTDPDCVPQSDWLSQIEATMRDPTLGVLVGPSLSDRSSYGLRLLDSYELQKEAYILASDDATLYWGQTSNMAVRSELMRRFGPFVEQERGADVVFVRTVVDATSCDVVRYNPDIGVTHLEMSSIGVYLRKVFLYGRSQRRYNWIIRSRALTLGERLRVFQNTIRAEQFSHFESTALFALLLLGAVCWYVGAATAGRNGRESQ